MPSKKLSIKISSSSLKQILSQLQFRFSFTLEIPSEEPL
jgi:hypothetical protein